MTSLYFQGIDSVWQDVAKCKVARGVFSLLLASTVLPSDIVEVPATDAVESEEYLVASLTSACKARGVDSAPLIVVTESPGTERTDAPSKD